MNLHDNKDIFEAAIQLASAPKEDGGLGIKQIYLEKAMIFISFGTIRKAKHIC